ncbi:MAG: helix-turn-helix domain-containing protein [Flavobacteriales bacterium]|jgi:transcriptional regulator with XRE-family HTH domain
MNYPKIRELRMLHNLKQEFVASQLNMSQPEYSRLENGLRDLKMEDLKQLSTLYGVNSNVFIPDSIAAEPKSDLSKGQMKRVNDLIPAAPYWTSLLNHHQELIETLLKSQSRNEVLLEKLLIVLDRKPA